jgi:DNA ligase-1
MHHLPRLSRRQWLAGAMAAWPLLATARAAAPQPLPLVLAHRAPDDVDPAGYLVSEKLDGVRGYWDGKALWFRSGLPVQAPAWFTAALPLVPLDGELWLSRGRFEALVGAVRRQQPLDAEWRAIRFLAFELPGAPGTFAQRAARLQQLLGTKPDGPAAALAQHTVPDRAALQRQLQDVVAQGGEGLMLHRAEAPFVAGRSSVLLKLKPRDDAEAQVIAHVEGRGRLQGRLGALRVRTVDGVVFHIGSGLSDALRASPPPVGNWVTYTHRGLTERGVPRFATYLRLRTL